MPMIPLMPARICEAGREGRMISGAGILTAGKSGCEACAVLKTGLAGSSERSVGSRSGCFAAIPSPSMRTKSVADKMGKVSAAFSRRAVKELAPSRPACSFEWPVRRLVMSRNASAGTTLAAVIPDSEEKSGLFRHLSSLAVSAARMSAFSFRIWTACWRKSAFSRFSVWSAQAVQPVMSSDMVAATCQIRIRTGRTGRNMVSNAVRRPSRVRQFSSRRGNGCSSRSFLAKKWSKSLICFLIDKCFDTYTKHRAARLRQVFRLIFNFFSTSSTVSLNMRSVSIISCTALQE